MKTNKALIFVLVLMSMCLTGCEPENMGNSISGYKAVRHVKIQPLEAVKLAKQHLDKSFELRKASSDLERSTHREPIIHVNLSGDYYHIVKESYPAKSIYFYMNNAVKVHKNSGMVIPPE